MFQLEADPNHERFLLFEKLSTMVYVFKGVLNDYVFMIGVVLILGLPLFWKLSSILKTSPFLWSSRMLGFVLEYGVIFKFAVIV